MDTVAALLLVFVVPFGFYKMIEGMWGPDREHVHREIAVGRQKGHCACGLPMRMSKPRI